MKGLRMGMFEEVIQEVEHVAQQSKELVSEPAVFLPYAGNNDVFASLAEATKS